MLSRGGRVGGGEDQEVVEGVRGDRVEYTSERAIWREGRIAGKEMGQIFGRVVGRGRVRERVGRDGLEHSHQSRRFDLGRTEYEAIPL